MAHNNTVLGQMLQLLPRHIFEHQVETHAWQGPKPRKLSYWSQLVAMLYAQLSGKKTCGTWSSVWDATNRSSTIWASPR